MSLPPGRGTFADRVASSRLRDDGPGWQDKTQSFAQQRPNVRRVKTRPARELGPSYRYHIKAVDERERREAWYDVEDQGLGSPRALTWQEARMDALPYNDTVRAIVESVRPYGIFVGFVTNSAYVAKDGQLDRFQRLRGEDSMVRAFIPTEELVEDQALTLGSRVAVKILHHAASTGRVFASAARAEPQPWSYRPGLTSDELEAEAEEDGGSRLENAKALMPFFSAGAVGTERMSRDPEAEELARRAGM